MYDYAGGKADWLAAGLHTVGDKANSPRTGSLAREVFTCGLQDRAGEVAERLRAADQDVCIVINAERVVMGRVRARDIAPGDETSIEQVMESGPSTFRPDVPLAEIVEYMDKRDMQSALITTNDGILVGVVHRDEAEEALRRTGEPAKKKEA